MSFHLLLDLFVSNPGPERTLQGHRFQPGLQASSVEEPSCPQAPPPKKKHVLENFIKVGRSKPSPPPAMHHKLITLGRREVKQSHLILFSKTTIL